MDEVVAHPVFSRQSDVVNEVVVSPDTKLVFHRNGTVTWSTWSNTTDGQDD